MKDSFEIILSQLKNKEFSLNSLDFKSTKIGDAGAKDLCEAIKGNTSLNNLGLKNNEIGHAGAKYLSEALKVNSSLNRLDLWGNEIFAVGAKYLSEALEVNTGLKSLDLGWSKIGDAGAKDLRKALEVNTSLTSLDLWCNIIGDTGAKDLSEALKVNSSLNSLGLRNNDIGDAGARDLSEALEVNTSLKSLGLWSNEIGDAGAKDLSKALKVNTSLNSFDLGNNEIGNAGAKDLSGALKVNTGLNNFDLANNEIGDAGAKDLGEALKVNTSLNSLNLMINKITEEGILYLNQALQFNYTLLELKGIDTAQTTKYLTRNKALNECLKPFTEFVYKGLLLNDEKTIETILTHLEEILPDLHSLPEYSYPIEGYRLLTALGHMTSFDQKAKIAALECLLPAFKNKTFQRCANKMLGLLLNGSLSDVLIKDNLLQEGFLLRLYSFKDHLNEPEINHFVRIDLFKLTGKGNYTCREKQLSEENIKILTENEFLKLMKLALIRSQKENATSWEAQLLEVLLRSKVCNSYSLSTACLSKSFYDAFNNQYPKALSFTTIEHCILTFMNEKNDFLINIKAPSSAVIEGDVAEYKVKLIAEKSKGLEAIVDDLKIALAKGIPKLYNQIKIVAQKESQKEIQSDFLLYACRFLDEISLPLAFFIPIIGQLYLGARLANYLKPLTKGNYSFFGNRSTNQLNGEKAVLDWNFSSTN